MKKVILIIFIFAFNLYSKNSIYLLDEYTKEIELESKIVTKIASDILPNKKIYLYIPNIKELDKKIYSHTVKLVDSCEKANFIFVKYRSEFSCNKRSKDSFILTNNYRKLLSNEKYIGAFFWSKSRPNIVFVKKRLVENEIVLPSEYSRYIEEL